MTGRVATVTVKDGVAKLDPLTKWLMTIVAALLVTGVGTLGKFQLDTATGMARLGAEIEHMHETLAQLNALDGRIDDLEVEVATLKALSGGGP